MVLDARDEGLSRTTATQRVGGAGGLVCSGDRHLAEVQRTHELAAGTSTFITESAAGSEGVESPERLELALLIFDSPRKSAIEITDYVRYRCRRAVRVDLCRTAAVLVGF